MERPTVRSRGKAAGTLEGGQPPARRVYHSIEVAIRSPRSAKSAQRGVKRRADLISDCETRTLRSIGHLAKRARGKNARDGTKYGRSRTSARSFYVHHTQRLSMAAACGDIVHGIFESLRGLKQRAVARGSGGTEAEA